MSTQEEVLTDEVSVDEEELDLLTADQIFDVDDSKVDRVAVPEWRGSVMIKGLSGAERDEYEATIIEQDRKGNVRTRLANARAKLVVAAAVDKNGNQLFDDADVKRLGRKSAKALQRVYDKAAELAGLKDEDLEELVGNSDADQSDSSTSDSH